MPNQGSKLGPRLVTLCEDAFFFIASTGRFDVDGMHALAARRADQKGAPLQGMAAWEPWAHALCVAIAPIAAPRWLPMADAVLAGLSLEHGARGLRSLFTSKPSAGDARRVLDLGRLASRALGAVQSAAGTYSLDARATRAAFIASLGLPEADRAALDAEPPKPAHEIEVHGEIDSKIAVGIVRGAFFAAMSDGLDPREEAAVLMIATKLDVSADDVNESRTAARDAIAASKGFGDATVEGVRYVLEADPLDAERFAIAAARLILPAIHRRDAVTAINVGGPATLVHRHKIDKKQRESALALSWIAALRIDPMVSVRAELVRRHAAVAKDVGESNDADIRTRVEAYLEAELLR